MSAHTPGPCKGGDTMTQTDKQAHTLGPWTVFIDDGKWFRIRFDGTRDALENEAEANARLIAAAPDLLAACEGLIAAWGTEDPAFVYVAEAAIKKTAVAVAKAKGE